MATDLDPRKLNYQVALALGWKRESVIIGDDSYEWLDPSGRRVSYIDLPEWSTDDDEAVKALMEYCGNIKCPWELGGDGVSLVSCGIGWDAEARLNFKKAIGGKLAEVISMCIIAAEAARKDKP